ncbi:hypothetical protein NLX71_03160 [Paenibacillus sp. MZ04-78.2]|uniref:hypothetical protein n=1 Tax=Paenibacillus sp. MZ04-78.2 TaxID=2962034 RepID=UPI0020B8BA30|nr:hypothetical protein [Paenibacillus sp. MZ04-78.2]MCP3772315.1 hypothetical protein [Paenibacillus sp. MZ04-78.2]
MAERKGWIEAPGYADFLYEAEEREAMPLGIPRRLTDDGPERLIGAEIVDFGANYGTYGMGGPGFFGLTFVSPEGEERTLVYAVWESASGPGISRGRWNIRRKTAGCRLWATETGGKRHSAKASSAITFFWWRTERFCMYDQLAWITNNWSE